MKWSLVYSGSRIAFALHPATRLERFERLEQFERFSIRLDLLNSHPLLQAFFTRLVMFAFDREFRLGLVFFRPQA